MKHAKVSRAWRPGSARKRARGRTATGIWSALLFNVCLLLLPAASATAIFLIARDQLYAYEYSEQGARAVRARVERLAGGLILLDFDRTRQWDDLVAMELIGGDVEAARGFVLSARQMLPARDVSQLNRRASGNASDAEIELAALDLLTPGTRARYESTVPLLARRSASGAGQHREPEAPLGDQRDFEILARAMLAEGDADPVQFTLTGFGLGLAGEFTPRMAAGAAAVITSSRRQDFPPQVHDEIATLLSAAMPVAQFRREALASAEGEDAGDYPNAAAAFRAAVEPERAEAVKAALDEIGAMAEATSVPGASTLLTHAISLRDLPRLRLIAQAAGDRAVAVAKRLPRDGHLARAARGDLSFTRELTIAVATAAVAMAALAIIALWSAFQAGLRLWQRRARDEEEVGGGELVDTFRPWRPLN